MRLFLISLALWCVPTWAQSTFATLQGTVRDATESVVPSAKVTIRNTGTNVSLELTSNALGNYEAPNLNPGVYEVVVEAASFKKFVHSDIRLDARQVVRIDARLEVATTTTEVTVAAGGTPVITTETATIDHSLDARRMLPVNFRAGNTSLINLVALAPGVQVRGSSENFSIAGSRLSQNETSIDGISTIGMRNHDVLINMFPSAEIVREMRISSVVNNAEYQGAANVDTISRSGENTFHGSVFHYHQNGALDARNFFATGVPFKVANTFGGALGGPIRRDRTFFFLDYEGNRVAGQAVLAPNVPSVALRNGDFSQISGLTVRDPLAGTPFPGNRIPADRQSRTSLGLQEFYPLPNFGPPTLLSGNFRGSFPTRRKSDQFDIRLDHHLASTHFLFARFSFKNLRDGTVSFSLPTIGPSRETPHVRTLAFADSWTLTPRLVNEFRAGFARQWRLIEGPFHGPTIIRQLGIQGLHPDLPDRPGFPQIGITGFTTCRRPPTTTSSAEPASFRRP